MLCCHFTLHLIGNASWCEYVTDEALRSSCIEGSRLTVFLEGKLSFNRRSPNYDQVSPGKPTPVLSIGVRAPVAMVNKIEFLRVKIFWGNTGGEKNHLG